MLPQKREMNGIISISALKKAIPPKITQTVMIGVCLCTGFISGLKVSPASLNRYNPFHAETLDYSKLTWISSETIENFKIESSSVNSAEPGGEELKFTPFEMKGAVQKKIILQSFLKPRTSNLAKLQKWVNEIQKTAQRPKRNIYQDFQLAALKLQKDFKVAAGDDSASADQITSSASAAEEVTLIDHESPLTRSNSQVRMKKIEGGLVASLSDPFIEIPEHRIRRTPAVKRGVQEKIVPSKPVQPVKPVAQSEFLTLPKLVYTAIPSPLLKTLEKSNPAAEMNGSQIDGHLLSEENSAKLAPLATVIAQRTQAPNLEMGGAVRATGNENLNEETTAEIPLVTTVPVSDELSASDQKKLANDLLNLQFENQVSRTQALANNTALHTAVAPVSPPQAGTRINPADEENNTENETQNSTAHRMNGKTSDECSLLDNHQFIQPINSGTGETNSQICPTRKVWISKDQKDAGWVKVESDFHLPTLTLHPAPNQGSTLLINQNALALIALKTGIHVTAGMGTIIGTVPEGYKIEFSGRAEETEYFETNGHSYFAILNVEPGAGVIEIESKNNQTSNSTIFTPVLSDTVSYLDLATPQLQNLPIKVIKGDKVGSPDVVNLTVGISTQSGIKAITQADGTALLKNVNLVPGYPIFVDVSSRNGEAQGYTYRYELKRRKKSGFFVVKQFTESLIASWLKQVKQGLSDQSAMVIGIYDRKKLNGFVDFHTVKTEPLTSRFGLEPLNYSVLRSGSISASEPLEGDVPISLSIQVPEGLSQVQLLNEANVATQTQILPISPRVIHVMSD